MSGITSQLLLSALADSIKDLDQVHLLLFSCIKDLLPKDKDRQPMRVERLASHLEQTTIDSPVTKNTQIHNTHSYSTRPGGKTASSTTSTSRLSSSRTSSDAKKKEEIFEPPSDKAYEQAQLKSIFYSDICQKSDCDLCYSIFSLSYFTPCKVKGCTTLCTPSGWYPHIQRSSYGMFVKLHSQGVKTFNFKGKRKHVYEYESLVNRPELRIDLKNDSPRCRKRATAVKRSLETTPQEIEGHKDDLGSVSTVPKSPRRQCTCPDSGPWDECLNCELHGDTVSTGNSTITITVGDDPGGSPSTSFFRKTYTDVVRSGSVT